MPPKEIIRQEMKVYYAVDIGAPSESSGFFCWRWEAGSDSCKSFRKSKGWSESLEKISEDADKQHEIHLVLEAPLWGARKVINGKKIWKPRFKINTDFGLFHENPWYISAGAASGFMAQLFLKDLYQSLKDKQIQKRIELYEGYISGLYRHKASIPKPPADEDIAKIKLSKHGTDALELLLILANKDNPAGLIKKLDIKQVSLSPIVPIRMIQKYEGTETFEIGFIKDLIEQNIINFHKGEIILTQRIYYSSKDEFP
jgi:hypothetical protein